MKILLHDYCELEERSSRNLKVWKAFHLILYTFAAIFGILNYVFLQNTMQLVDNHCVLYPRELAYRMYDPRKNESTSIVDGRTNDSTVHNLNDAIHAMKNESTLDVLMEAEDDDIDDNPRLILDTTRTLFGYENDCEFAEYMPIMSTIFAAAWAVMFTMCPGGGHSRSGLQQPWRILTPALIFALVLVGLTGHSFTKTNGGLHAFCAAFYNVTNSTECSAASPYVQQSWNSSWGLGGRVGAARAASAAVWGSWAVAAALLLARCIAAPDFQVRATRAYLKDPQRKLTPYLKKQRRSNLSQPSPVSASSPSKRDTASLRSEGTLTTELVSGHGGHGAYGGLDGSGGHGGHGGQDTAPPSLHVTPVRGRPELLELKGVHRD